MRLEKLSYWSALTGLLWSELKSCGELEMFSVDKCFWRLSKGSLAVVSLLLLNFPELADFLGLLFI